MAKNDIIKKRYRLKLNSIDKIEELLQELYNESDKIIVEIQNNLNKLVMSVDLNNEIADAKAKIAKAINDYIKSKDNAIGRKLEIAKLMTEIHKYNGNISAVASNNEFVCDIETLKTMYSDDTEEKSDNNEEERYEITK